MENEEKIKDYINETGFDIEKLINRYYNYVYVLTTNIKGITLSNEDVEEIISDVFLAIWKNSKKLEATTYIKPYLIGIVRNIIKNKYRTTNIDYPISDYEEKILDTINLEKIAEEREQNKIIKLTLKNMKNEEYKVFIMFYYSSKKIKEIATELKISESKVKVILHRVRKKIKKNLKERGYEYGR